MDHSYIDKNLERIRADIAAACHDSGRANDVTIVAAVKSADADEIDYLHRQLGICDVGENRVQQLLEHYAAIDREGLRIHFIGTLQTNKVKYIVDKVAMIQSLDSMKLALEINKRAEKIGKVIDVLIEINSGEEENKSGISPSDAEQFALDIASLSNIRLCGFMTMAPRCSSEEEYTAYFENTKRLCDRIWYDVLCRTDKPILSMGMSESLISAVKAGATVIRPGRSLFSKGVQNI
ncbi:MAG: YggS family pyridoxal phosphate-dependent enzyme [Clostridia bacterium]|nr:YggS family pyridoxal phosphate-dependent enzyme [Clostridia bacterium]